MFRKIQAWQMFKTMTAGMQAMGPIDMEMMALYALTATDVFHKVSRMSLQERAMLASLKAKQVKPDQDKSTDQ